METNALKLTNEMANLSASMSKIESEISERIADSNRQQENIINETLNKITDNQDSFGKKLDEKEINITKTVNEKLSTYENDKK
jgi:hypothetical protein